MRRFYEARQAFAKAEQIAPDNANVLWERTAIHLQESGDVTRYAYLSHLMDAPYPEAVIDTWRSSLYLRDFDAALQDVINWQERFLVSKDLWVTRPLLTALTHLYSGNANTARPLLLDAREEFEILLTEAPENYPILRTLCFITGGLSDLAKAEQYCADSLLAAPKDAFLVGMFKFDAAAGLALAGDAQGSVGLLRAMLEGDAGPTMYQVIYHPAFDGIREDAAYIELLEQYSPENKQP